MWTLLSALSDDENGRPDIRLLTGAISAAEGRVGRDRPGAPPAARRWQPSLDGEGRGWAQVKLGPFHAAKLLALISLSALFFFCTLDVSMSRLSAGLMSRE